MNGILKIPITHESLVECFIQCIHTNITATVSFVQVICSTNARKVHWFHSHQAKYAH